MTETTEAEVTRVTITLGPTPNVSIEIAPIREHDGKVHRILMPEKVRENLILLARSIQVS